MAATPQIAVPTTYVDRDLDAGQLGTEFAAASMNPNFVEIQTKFNEHAHTEYETSADAANNLVLAKNYTDASLAVAKAYTDTGVAGSATALATHAALTQNIHGITDTSKLFYADNPYALATSLVLGSRVTGDAQDRFTITADGKHQWGSGSVAPDVNLYRTAGVLNTNGQLAIGTTTQGIISLQNDGYVAARFSAGVNNATFVTRLATGDITDRFRINSDGKHQWGDGTSAVDTNIYRQQAGVLRTDSTMWVPNISMTGTTPSITAAGATSATLAWLISKISTDATNRFLVDVSGKHQWGDGTLALDTTLSRSSAGVLQLSSQLSVGAASIGNALSTFVNGDSANRFQLQHGGIMNWGSGALATDTTLQRTAANTLQLGTTTQAGRLDVISGGAGNTFLSGRVTTDTAARFVLGSDGTIQWGSGASATDITMFRQQAGVLQLGTSSQNAQLRLIQGASTNTALATYTTTDTVPRLLLRSDGQIGWGAGGASAQDAFLARVSSSALQISSQLLIAGAGATSVLYRASVTGDTVDRLSITADGKHQWGTGALAADTTFYRWAAGAVAVGSATQAGRYNVFGLLTGDIVFSNRVGADANDRLRITADGRLAWADGTSAPDVNLYRSAVGRIASDNIIQATQGLRAEAMALVGNTAFATSVTGDTNDRLIISAAGTHVWGSGSATGDTNLYRSAAAVLATDHLFTAITLGLATKVKAGAPVDADWAAAPPNGTIVVDTTNSKIWVRTGAATWKGVVVA